MTRRALVTGASRGLGAAVAEAFRAEGYEVVAPARAEVDLADATAVEQWCAAHEQDEIDVLVNNAGINPIAPLRELELAAWQETLAVDLTAPFLLTRTLGRGMADRGWGRIVNVGSAYALVTRAGRGAYTAAKHGLAGLTRAAAVELAPHGVLVNAVLPGFVGTDLTYRNNDAATIERLVAGIPLGRLAEPAEIAELTLWLCSDRNSYVTGQLVAADGGFLAT